MTDKPKPAPTLQDPQSKGREAYNKLDDKAKKQVDTLVLKGLEDRIAMTKACGNSGERVVTELQQEKDTSIAAVRGAIIASGQYKNVTVDPRLEHYSLNSAMLKPAKIAPAATGCIRIGF